MNRMEQIAQDVRNYTSDPQNKLNDPRYFDEAKRRIWDMTKHWDMQAKETGEKI